METTIVSGDRGVAERGFDPEVSEMINKPTCPACGGPYVDDDGDEEAVCYECRQAGAEFRYGLG